MRSELQFRELLEYDLLFKWFLDLNIMGLSFDHSLLSKDKQRRLNSDVAREFLLATVEQAREQRLLSEEHFSVDGSLLEAGASVKNFRHRDEHQPSGGRSGDGGGSNRDVDFRGERRRYETHGSTTDPEARNGTGNLPNQPESIVNQTSGPGRSRQRVMLRRPQATHLHSTTQFQHPAKENQMTSNGELIWGVIVFSHLLMVLYCYLLGSHSLQLLSRKFDRKTREKYRRWKVDQDLFPPTSALSITAKIASLILLVTITVSLAAGSTYLLVESVQISIDQTKTTLILAADAMFLGCLGGYSRFWSMNEKIKQLEALRMVFRAKFSVAEIWSMYESLRHAPALFWEEYKNLPDVEVSPNPPMDGARIAEGGEEVTDATVRARIRVDWRLAGGLSALLGVLIAACDGCGERDGGIGHGKKHSRTGPGASWRGS